MAWITVGKQQSRVNGGASEGPAEVAIAALWVMIRVASRSGEDSGDCLSADEASPPPALTLGRTPPRP